MSRIKFISALLLLSVLIGCSPQATPKPVSPTEVSPQPSVPPAPDQIKVSVLPFLSYAPLFIAQEEGYFADQNLEVEFVNLATSEENVPALLSGQIDVMAGLVTVGLINAMANNVNMRIVADKGFLDANGCSSVALLARSDLVENGVLTLTEEERAQALVSYGQTTIHDYYFDNLMGPQGMDSSVVKSIQIPFHEIPAAFSSGSLDMSMIAEPWVSRILATGSATVLYDLKIEFPNTQYSTLLYGPSLLETNPDAGRRFMVAYLQAVRQYLEGATDRNIEIINKNTEITPEELKSLCWQPMRADGSINTETLLVFQEWAVSKGYLEKTIPTEMFWNPTFIEYAQSQIQ